MQADLSSTAAADETQTYFESYDDINIHKVMLKDTSRLLAYKRFIEENCELFAKKVVVDVGSGTGILSLLAAQAGAKHVYAIEVVKSMCILSRKIIEQNGYADRITVLEGQASDVQLPNGVLADVLISEWMGFYLLHESMLEAVVTARDRLLCSGGVVFPSTATLFACPVSLKEYCAENFDFWQDICGFDFSEAASVMRQKCFMSPEVMSLSEKSLLAEPQQLLSIDLQFVTADDVRTVMASLDFVMLKNDLMHGFALWFNVQFDGCRAVTLDTSPLAPPTHWQQTVILLPSALLVNRDSLVQCRFLLQQTENHRRYNITVEMLEDEDNDDGDDDFNDKEENDDDKPQHSLSATRLIKDAMHKLI